MRTRSSTSLTTRAPTRRGGYVLLMCLLVVAVSSSIVLTLFNMLRLQTAESMARRQAVVANSLVSGGIEHAIAVLIDQPTFRGTIGPVSVPSTPAMSYTVQIVDVSGDMRLDVTADTTLTQQAQSRMITATELEARRQKLGVH